MIVGLLGRARSGKDTFASRLEARGFVRTSFAQPLKDACRVLFGLTDAHLGDLKDVADPNLPTRSATPRQILQEFGTDVMRKHYGDGFWVDRFVRDLPPGNVVVTDVRFQNEVDALRGLGGVIIKIERPGEPKMSHASEQVDDISADLVVVNDGSLEDFIAKVDELIQYM